MMKKIFVNLVIGTLLSMLVFFSISFFSAVYSIKHDFVHSEFNLGYPFKYYYAFWLGGSEGPNWGGNGKNLLLDCFICWVIVTGIYCFVKRKKL